MEATVIAMPRMTVGVPEHVARRPSWDCAVCAEPWPCATAKVQLSEQYGDNEGALLVYLGQLMWDAIEDGLSGIRLGRAVVPPELRDRFTEWVVEPLIARRPDVA